MFGCYNDDAITITNTFANIMIPTVSERDKLPEQKNKTEGGKSFYNDFHATAKAINQGLIAIQETNTGRHSIHNE